MCDFFFFGGDFLFSFWGINNMTSCFFDKLCFFKIKQKPVYIISLTCTLTKKKNSSFLRGLTICSQRPTVSQPVMLKRKSCVFWQQDQVASPGEQRGPQDQTGPWCPLSNTWQMLADYSPQLTGHFLPWWVLPRWSVYSWTRAGNPER